MRNLVGFSIILFILPFLGTGSVHIPILPTDFHELTADLSLSTIPCPSDIDATFLKVLLSTGSNEVWVPSSYCDFDLPWCSEKGHFNNKESHNYHDANRNFTTNFKDGFVTGFVGIDQIEAGGVDVPDMEFGQAIGSTPNLDWGQYDGVLGLGPRRTSAVGTTFLQRLIEEGQLDDAVFSFNLKSDSPYLMLGGLNYNAYTGDMLWSKSTNNDMWQISADVRLGSTSLCGKDCQVQFNTGVELIVGPKKQVDILNKILDSREIPGVTIRSVDCDKIPSFPDLTLTVAGGKTVKIAPSEYIASQKMGSYEFCYLLIASEEYITLGSDDMWVIGAAGHRALYVAYDFGRTQVGLGQIV